MTVLFKDLTIEERIPVYLTIMQSSIATAFNEASGNVPDISIVNDLTNKAFEQLPVSQKDWIFKYFDGGRALAKTIAFMETSCDSEHNTEWEKVDAHEDPMTDQGIHYLDVKNMPSEDIQCMIVVLTLQLLIAILSEYPHASTEECVDLSLDIIWNCACAFIEDDESRQEFYKYLDPEEVILERIQGFLETFNKAKVTH